jgi:predicted nuclease of predicted toxin-antitoxin system
MTKDGDFVDLLDQHGAPPQVILVTCGNTSNARLRQINSS